MTETRELFAFDILGKELKWQNPVIFKKGVLRYIGGKGIHGTIGIETSGINRIEGSVALDCQDTSRNEFHQHVLGFILKFCITKL